MKRPTVKKPESEILTEADCFFCSATGWVFDGEIAALCKACLGDGTMKMPKSASLSGSSTLRGCTSNNSGGLHALKVSS